MHRYWTLAPAAQIDFPRLQLGPDCGIVHPPNHLHTTQTLYGFPILEMRLEATLS